MSLFSGFLDVKNFGTQSTMPKRITPEMDLLDQQVVQHIEEFGWHVMLVGESDGLPGWAYSIGLYESFRHPEIITFGLPNDVMHRAINNLGEQIRSGKMYDAGFEYDEPFDGLKCLFHLVHKNWYPLFVGRATRFYEGDDFPILQCIWPDKNRNYPWSPKFHRELITKQPWLFRPDFRDARVAGYLRDYVDNTPLDQLVRALDNREPTTTFICSKHKIDPDEWPFEHPKRLVVYADRNCATETPSVVAAFHEPDGTWLLFTTVSKEEPEPLAVCFGCVYRVDPSVADIADLPLGWRAFRRKPGEVWERKPQEEE